MSTSYHHLRPVQGLPMDRAEYGGKALGLTRLLEAGLPVPEAWVVPASVLSDLRAAVPGEHAPQAVPAPSPELLTELCQLGEALGYPLMVRSSGGLEDGEQWSYAGQYHSEVVTEAEALGGAVQRCWASLLGEEVGQYHRDARPGTMAVILQRMIAGRSAGVAFGVHPVTGSWSELLLESVSGMGEALVSGQVPADQWVIARPRKLRGGQPALRLLTCTPGQQARAMTVDPEGPRWTPLPPELSKSPKISEAEALEIADMVLRIERALDCPQDLEWVISEAGAIYLVQTRPITSRTTATPAEGVIWTRRFAGERWQEPVTPMTWSIMEELLQWFIAWPETSESFLGGEEATRLYQGYPYFNATIFRHLLFKLPGRPPPRFMLDLLPSSEGERWRSRFASAPDWRVYLSIFRTTFQEKRWRRFRWNPLTNWRSWEELESELWEALAEPAGEDPQEEVQRCIELSRRYIGVHIISLLCANLFFELGQAMLPADLREALLRSPEGNKTLAVNRALRALGEGGDQEAFLREFGHRSLESSWEIFARRWIDHPEELEPLSLAAMRSEGELSAQERVEARAAETKHALGELRRRHPGALGWLLERWMRLTWRYLRLREDQRFAFEALMLRLRRSLEAMAQRSMGEQGARQVRWLQWSELQSLHRGELKLTDLAERLAQRERDWCRHRDQPLPPTFLIRDEPWHEPSGSCSRLQGMGISPGRVRGPVRILSSPREASRLQQGDILVTVATDPGWTPLFMSAGGLILELGSMLSHGAVVAREYGLPAVVNVEGATQRLRDGQEVILDGRSGQVWLVPEEL